MSSLPDLTYHCSGSHWLAPGVAPAELRASMISKMRMLSAASAGVAGKSSRTGRSMLLNVFVQWNCGRLSIVFQSS